MDNSEVIVHLRGKSNECLLHAVIKPYKMAQVHALREEAQFDAKVVLRADPNEVDDGDDNEWRPRHHEEPERECRQVRLQTKIKRGTATRDQDTHTVKTRGETPEEAAKNLSEVLEELKDKDVFDRVRRIE